MSEETAINVSTTAGVWRSLGVAQRRSAGKILAVDDDPLGLEMLRLLLGADYQYLTAESGPAAIELATKQRPDVILLDLTMPGMDGYETCRKIREHPQLSYSKIMLLSGRDTTRERLAGYRAGADGFLPKPFDPEELLAKIAVFLRLRCAEELDGLKDQLLTLVAHELRTPLTGIVPAGEVLMDPQSLAADDRRMFAQMVLDESSSLLKLTEQGLLLCRLNAGETILRRAEVNLVDVCRRFASERSSATATNLEFESMLFEQPIAVDEALLRQALGLLLDELVQLEAETDTIGLRVDTAGDMATITVTRARGDLDICVETLAPFGPERQGGELTGANLALALARAIFQAHGGNLELTERTSTQTSLTGWLPRTADAH